jgi:hypothetical protein
MTLPQLSEDDREALRSSASNLGDIPQESRDRIETGFDRAYAVAGEIRSGVRNPLRWQEPLKPALRRASPRYAKTRRRPTTTSG